MDYLTADGLERRRSLTKPTFGWSRLDVAWIAILVVVAALSWMPRWSGSIELRWDAGVYYTLGTSLAQGRGYRLLNEPGEILAVQYPPLVPAIVALHQILGGTDDPFVIGPWLKLTWLTMFLLFIAGTYAVLRGFFGWRWSLAGTSLCILNFSLYFHASQCASELPFGLASVAFVLALRLRSCRKRETAAGAAGVAAFLARSMGIALLGAWILDGVLRREFRLAAVRSFVVCLCLLGWNGYIRWVESSPAYTRPAYPYQRAEYLFYNVSYARNVSYKDPFQPEQGKLTLRDMLKRLAENAKVLPESVGATVSTPRGFWMSAREALRKAIGVGVLREPVVTAALWGLGILTFVGVGLLVVRRQWFIPVYILATAAAICSSPWPSQMLRYLAPIVPLLLVAFLSGLLALRSRLSGLRTPWLARLVRIAPGALLAAILALQVRSYIVAHTDHFQSASIRTRSGAIVTYRQLWYRQEDRGLDESIDWIHAHAQPGDVVAASMPHWIYLRTRLKTVMPPFEPDPAKAQELLDSVPVRYLLEENPDILTNVAWRYMNKVLHAFPERWKLVHTSPGDYVKVYERTTPGENAGVLD